MIRYARSHDGKSFVVYMGDRPESYTKLVLSANETYRLAEALRLYHAELAVPSYPVAAESATDMGIV